MTTERTAIALNPSMSARYFGWAKCSGIGVWAIFVAVFIVIIPTSLRYFSGCPAPARNWTESGWRSPRHRFFAVLSGGNLSGLWPVDERGRTYLRLVQFVHEDINDPDGIVFCDVSIEPLGEQSALALTFTCNETLHNNLGLLWWDYCGRRRPLSNFGHIPVKTSVFQRLQTALPKNDSSIGQIKGLSWKTSLISRSYRAFKYQG